VPQDSNKPKATPPRHVLSQLWTGIGKTDLTDYFRTGVSNPNPGGTLSCRIQLQPQSN